MLSFGVLEPAILGLLSMLLVYAIFTVKRYIDKDSEWKTDVSKLITIIDSREKHCLQRFASKHTAQELFHRIDEHAVKLAAIKQWIESHEKK